MDEATMLYKCPGPHDLHGGRFDYVIVDATEVEAKLAEGWHLTTPEAKAAHDAAQAAKVEATKASSVDDLTGGAAEPQRAPVKGKAK